MNSVSFTDQITRNYIINIPGFISNDFEWINDVNQVRSLVYLIEAFAVKWFWEWGTNDKFMSAANENNYTQTFLVLRVQRSNIIEAKLKYLQ